MGLCPTIFLDAAIDSYSYTALNESAGQIKLLSLLPGDFGDEIVISIQEVVLSMSEKPIFEALSYVWGSDADMVPIVIRGAVDTCLTVTPYLEIALRYLRYQEKLRILWIDAICINQNDLEERSAQVQRMAEIYALAESVLVWLGPEEHQSEKALHMLDNLGSEVEVDWPSRIVKSTLTGDVAPHERWGSGCSRINNDVWVAIFHLLGRPWFERL